MISNIEEPSPTTSPPLSPSTSPTTTPNNINKKKIFSLKTIISKKKQQIIEQQTEEDNNVEKILVFDNLPFEVIEKIFSYLYEIDISRVSLVCLYWNEISKSNEIWLNIYKKRSFHCQLLKQNVKEIDFKSVLKLRKSIQSNWRNGKFKCTVLQGHTESINSILFTGNKIISTSRDSTLKVWDYYSNECIKTFNNKSIINSIEKDYDNKRIACGTLNGFLNIYNLETSKLEHTEKAHYGYVATLKANNDSTIFCSGAKDKEIKLWKFNDGEDIDSGDDDDDNDIIKGNCNGNISKKSLLIKKLGSHESSVTNIEWCNLNNNHVWSSSGKLIKQWNIETGQLLTTFESPLSRIINQGCLSVKEGMVACSGEGPIGIFDPRVNSILPIKTLSTNSPFVYCLQYEPTLNSLVIGCSDKKVKCYNVDTGLLEQEFLGHTQPVSYLNYDQNHIVSSGIDGNLWVWNYDTNMSQNLTIPSSSNSSSSSSSGTINLQQQQQQQQPINSNNNSNNNNNNILKNNNTGSPRRVGSFHKLEGHYSYIRANYTDESKIITGSHDNTIRIWDFSLSILNKKDHKCNLM